MRLLLGLIIALGASGAALASSPFDLYEQGKYDAAIAAGVAANDAAGFAIAARATLAAETMGKARCLDCIEKAEAFARKAIAADPRNSDGQVFLAVALGREGRLESSFTVLRKGYPSEARRALDAALAADPHDAFAWGALGGWNIGLVSAGGARLAHVMYGASLDDGLADFDKAFALAPDNVALRYQYALSLSACDVDLYRGKIADALTRAVVGKPNGVYEAFAQSRAKELLTVLKQN